MRVLGSTERMAIHQTKKQTDLEKRLRLLRQQVYGQNTSRSEDQTFRYPDTLAKSGTPKSSESFRSDITYLRQDLFKILTLSTLAIGIQLALFFLSENHILNLVFL